MNSTFALFILGWTVVMVALLAIGGYFMFRKFLKRLPKEDGKSIIDWEEHYIEETLHMWNDEQKAFLEELVTPVPELFRDVAKQKIAARIAQVALQKKAKTITQDIIIEGYILATPKRDHKFLKKTLHEKNIDVQPYQPLFEQS
ncbi:MULTISPECIES: DUF2621 domain-containing protein [Pontibacillus]|uniref:DUF2621 domain-containing protein n=1 Tax=Pontibacillus chungwhensis TaxID=265426 RepID=A0ABY8V2Q3_9BACI|nr:MULTISPECIES: DUF2621 domain-containing protein [Pontibacillus]MCD5322788.1 DUF2621 domain-containing protein [Pontibacillus sp. HN14]WIG00058.1 DUF2621 domain-containing protein [Pontibacillus chungwhensis]